MTALYPGSFDPATLGHVDLVCRALPLFDHVTVAVAVNSQKQPTFSPEERVEILREALPDDDRLSITTFSGLVVEYCAAHGIGAILRGLRGVSDFDAEYQMALTNRQLAPDIESVFVMSSAEYAHLSSSLIRDIVRNGGDAAGFLPASAERRLRERLGPD